MVFRLYNAGVVDPYNYPNFIKKWHLLCRHIKRCAPSRVPVLHPTHAALTLRCDSAGRAKDGFSICHVCLQLKMQLMSTSLDRLERTIAQQKLERHNAFQMAQRAKMERHVRKAIAAMSRALNAADAEYTVPEYMSITLDCMSSQKGGTFPSDGVRTPKGVKKQKVRV